jgi:hypothetical protein
MEYMPPSWVFYMVGVCFAAFVIGWIIAAVMDELSDK